jgi:hypothetical protein
MRSMLDKAISAIALQQLKPLAVDFALTCGLTGPGGFHALIVWNSVRTNSYQPARGYKHYLDLSGGKYPINRPITIGYNLILFTN